MLLILLVVCCLFIVMLILICNATHILNFEGKKLTLLSAYFFFQLILLDKIYYHGKYIFTNIKLFC